ncbi:hypothetical protein [Leisingera sp. ANG-DT]|uniref:hypothetical protein n=1 Tax=Leisingera sp. ANG-DT TaxID=1577897 RepID=UPI0019D36068|nr:hypothetical protein [Leisingera sp. ANG-DT]
MFFLGWAVVLPLFLLAFPGFPLIFGLISSFESSAISLAFAVAVCVYALAVLSLISPMFFGGYLRALQAFLGNIKPCEQRLKETRQAYADLKTEAS